LTAATHKYARFRLA